MKIPSFPHGFPMVFPPKKLPGHLPEDLEGLPHVPTAAVEAYHGSHGAAGNHLRALGVLRPVGTGDFHGESMENMGNL